LVPIFKGLSIFGDIQTNKQLQKLDRFIRKRKHVMGIFGKDTDINKLINKLLKMNKDNQGDTETNLVPEMYASRS